jgi:hypothetical protein
VAALVVVAGVVEVPVLELVVAEAEAVGLQP